MSESVIERAEVVEDFIESMQWAPDTPDSVKRLNFARCLVGWGGSMTRNTKAPCGCDWRSHGIQRQFRILFPTVFVDCWCSICAETWTERYEFDFSVPLGGITNEKADEVYGKEKG